ncbi:MAG: Mut7-C RNAse domain-containing protein [Candidatus Promineifilaceae bacterium]
MSTIQIRFYARLNKFLPPDKRQKSLLYPLNGPLTTKHMVEASGIPHTEVHLLIINGRPVTFDYQLQPGDRLAVYPEFTTLDTAAMSQLRPPLPQPPRFVADVHLGRLTTFLRLLGFDTLYPEDYDDEVLAQISHDQERILLTRDRRLLMRKIVTYGCCLHSHDSYEQLQTVLHRYNLFDQTDPWQRCLRCNGRLTPVSKEAILHRLEPKTKQYYHDFRICEECQHIYWKGSHYAALQEFINRIQSKGIA